MIIIKRVLFLIIISAFFIVVHYFQLLFNYVCAFFLFFQKNFFFFVKTTFLLPEHYQFAVFLKRKELFLIFDKYILWKHNKMHQKSETKFIHPLCEYIKYFAFIQPHPIAWKSCFLNRKSPLLKICINFQ